MASAFSICALAVTWRVYIPPGGAAEQNGNDIPDPKWLIGVNGAQLGIALISNLSLLMNMARRIRFSIAQPVTIIGWYLSSIALVGLTACAAGPLKLEPPERHAFSQAYYYAIIAAGLYFMVATLMVVTVWGAYKGHYDKEFQLTMSQRTLMLQTISFLVYLLAGATVYSHIEGWKFLDAVYWADFTLLTIGIGDYAPETHLGRGLLFPFAIGGIIILGLVIGSIRSLVLSRGKDKMGARMVEKQRRRLLKRMQTKNKGTILEPVNEDRPPLSPSSSRTIQENPENLNERQRREQEFNLMRQIQEAAATRRRWISLVISAATWLVLWFAGAAVFQAAEYGQDWSYFGSLYFAYTSLLTIGYGDFSPQSNSGKSFFVFWSLLAIPSLTILISNMGDTIVKGIRDATLWVGNFTVLPGEQGIKTTLKGGANKLSGGRMFSNDLTAPGFLGETNKNIKDDEEDNQTGDKNDPESGAQRLAGDNADHETTSAAEKAGGNDELPESKPHYHCILIKEIGKVMRHLKSSPPRKYTFDEWAWYLKLIGEDESSAETHEKAARNPTMMRDGAPRVGEGEGADRVEWSWVGETSPLMGDKEEAEWVLERLTLTLERELETLKREEAEGGRMRKEEGARERNEDEGPLSEQVQEKSMKEADQIASEALPRDVETRSEM
jgi:potassium channel subfamily K